jgi:hypothetical protein
MSTTPPGESPAGPAKLRFKRSATAAHEDEASVPGAGAAGAIGGAAPRADPPPRYAPDARGDLEADGREKAAKSIRITTSKILGTAQPRRPRIGPEFQAAIPPLPGGPPAADTLAALRAARAAPPPPPGQQQQDAAAAAAAAAGDCMESE